MKIMTEKFICSFTVVNISVLDSTVFAVITCKVTTAEFCCIYKVTLNENIKIVWIPKYFFFFFSFLLQISHYRVRLI